MLNLRSLVFSTAEETEGVGRLTETLKWGQPSYLTSETGSGTTIRIDGVKGDPGKIGLYVHCQTSLLERFRAEYPEAARYDGNRAVVLDVTEPFPQEALRHMIAMALTYHLSNKTRSRTKASRAT